MEDQAPAYHLISIDHFLIDDRLFLGENFIENFLILNSILLNFMTYNVGVNINGKKKEVESA